ncbi:unnamed protein product [Phyllotreta striolata]|uniref:Uncharacterized protein n=1 Tax=Phyllotreta striolata TaxID=444603 RepID=A0A9N9TNV0_PHYSR|nr:unnamed protein product [Phyllotreta striolata]
MKIKFRISDFLVHALKRHNQRIFQKFRRSFKTYTCLILVTGMLLYFYNFQLQETDSLRAPEGALRVNKPINYLINTSTCQIPNDDPFNDDVMPFLKVEERSECSKYGLLSYIDKKNGVATLNVNKSLLSTYSNMPITCCYSNITRTNYEFSPDNEIKLSSCVPFESVVLYYPYVQVNCYNVLKNVYTNVHATALYRPRKRENSENSKFSVLLLGIDSMSKSNLIRTMPKTFRYLEDNFYNLRGYTKIGENTLPNLMAILSGHNMDQLNSFCNDSVKFNNCKFIWDKFKALGYVTAYLEDEVEISTFNYNRAGFSEEPTDLYYRAYMIASEKLKLVLRYGLYYCTGPEVAGERVLNAAKDFAITFKDSPSFGLFWANSFSHNDINLPSTMDESMLNMLTDPELLRAMDNTILILFSDHGFRFGDIRYTHSGWLEERLPFIYFHLPEKFKRIHRDKFDNFMTNTRRLTVPYDVFNTLQDILRMGNPSYVVQPSEGCISCQSLFAEVPENRTCNDAQLSKHWCTCKGHVYIDPNSPQVRSLGDRVVNKINDRIANSSEGYLCSTYSFRRFIASGISKPYVNSKNQSVNYYLLMIETNPRAMFEATIEVSVESNDIVEVFGLGRIDWYKPVTWCIRKSHIKGLCYCPWSSVFGYVKNVLFNIT